ncbi:MAG: MATE family efflux transporter [Rhodospirillaceae bacterium]|nr:MATE family efflux transporter [Rhodospirillaceae bacterium]MDE0617703.1 MATE family efflux transporter [Rhodospirillaceae bacterium]
MTAARPEARPEIWILEARQTIRLAVPLALMQLSQIAMSTVDVLMIGRLGKEALAGAALGSTLIFLWSVTGMGLVTAVAPLAAQAFGAEDPVGVRRVTRQGLWVTALVSVPGLFALLAMEPVLLWMDQPAVAVRGAGDYLAMVAWSLPMIVGFVVLRCFGAALNRPKPALWMMLAGIPLNALLDYALIFGELGAPRMELAGAGLATTIVQTFLFLGLLWFSTSSRDLRDYRILMRFWRPDWAVFRRIFAIGLPIAGIYLIEMGVFAFAVVMMGWIGATAIAAHHIAIQVAAVTFMVPMGIGQAATVRVGQALGRRDPAGIRRAGFSALGIGIVFMSAMSLLIALFPATLAGLFLDRGMAGSAEVLALAASLLYVAAAFQIVDGMQAIAAGALRGLNDTRIPMVAAAVGYWIIGFGIGWTLGFAAGWGAVGIWIGLALGLASTAVFFVTRFNRMTRSGTLSPEPAAQA